MKKLILPISLIALLSITTLCFADYTGAPHAPDIPIDLWGPNSVIKTVTNWFFGIVLLIAVIMIIAAGFNYVISAGNEAKVKTAMNLLIYALVGVAIALLAKGLVYVICLLLKTTGTCTFF